MVDFGDPITSVCIIAEHMYYINYGYVSMM